MGIKTLTQPPYSPDVAPCDFWLFPKLRGCRYETIEEMQWVVTKVIDTLTQENFQGAFQKLFAWYKKWFTAGGDYFEEYSSFKCVHSINVLIRKKSGNLFNDPLKWPKSALYNNLKTINWQQSISTVYPNDRALWNLYGGIKVDFFKFEFLNLNQTFHVDLYSEMM